MIATTVSIRDAGFDEFWLRDQICDNTSILKLGELELLAKEKNQASGGRLDILLKNPDDDTMFEVEVMLGETDESHIIRTIEYWDKEKRKYPQRQHFPVLVAETITQRFFNVIHIFSHSIPIIAIQVNLVEVEGKRGLHFSKILDAYEEPDDLPNETYEAHDEAYWREKAPWTLEAAKTLLDLLKPVLPTVRLYFVKSYIKIDFGKKNYISLRKRDKIGEKTYIGFGFSGKNTEAARKLLDEAEIYPKQKQEGPYQYLKFTCDSKALKNHSAVFTQLAELAKE